MIANNALSRHPDMEAYRDLARKEDQADDRKVLRNGGRRTGKSKECKERVTDKSTSIM